MILYNRVKSPMPKFEQACQVAQNAILCLSMSTDWVYHTFSNKSQPSVLDPLTGQLEVYNHEGKYSYSNLMCIQFIHINKPCKSNNNKMYLYARWWRE